MILKKIVEVEATSEEVRNYLRCLISRATEFRPGDAAVVRSSCRVPTGTSVVCHDYDQSDDTVAVMHVDASGVVHQAWVPRSALRMEEHLPVGWVPSESGRAAATAAEEMRQAAQADIRSTIAAGDSVLGPFSRRVPV